MWEGMGYDLFEVMDLLSFRGILFYPFFGTSLICSDIAARSTFGGSLERPIGYEAVGGTFLRGFPFLCLFFFFLFSFSFFFLFFFVLFSSFSLIGRCMCLDRHAIWWKNRNFFFHVNTMNSRRDLVENASSSRETRHVNDRREPNECGTEYRRDTLTSKTNKRLPVGRSALAR